MKSGIFKEFVVPTLVLTLICLFATAALAATNSVTAPIIKEANERAAQEARVKVLPEADSFTPIQMEGIEGLVDIYKADNGAGYVVTTEASGYGGLIRVMTGITSDGAISQCTVLSQSESPGLGTRVAEEPYLSQYPGKTRELEGVDVISGSTTSSKAFELAVDTAFQAYEQAAGKEAA